MTETEYMIMFMCVKTNIWLTQMLQNMNLEKYLRDNLYYVSIQKNKTHWQSLLLQLKENNQTALTLVKNAYMHKRLKHIDVIYHHVHNLHLKNQIEMFFMLSADIIADKLIKFLLRQMFKYFVNQLRLNNSESQ